MSWPQSYANAVSKGEEWREVPREPVGNDGAQAELVRDALGRTERDFDSFL